MALESLAFSTELSYTLTVHVQKHFIELVERTGSYGKFGKSASAMVTADNSEDSRQKAVEYGAKGYITKPFLDQAVLLVLDQLT